MKKTKNKRGLEAAIYRSIISQIEQHQRLDGGRYIIRFILCHVKIASEDAHKCLFELLVGQGVAEGVHGAVCVTQEVGEHVEVAVGARRLGTEALDQSQNVIGRPAGDERSQNEGDGSQSFAGSILRFRFLTLFPSSSSLFPAALDPFAN